MIEVAIETIVARRKFGVVFSWTVLTAGHEDYGCRIRVRAGLDGVGERRTIDGTVRDTAYRRQVVALSARRTVPNGELIRRFLASNVPGIGPKRTDRLCTYLGDSLAGVLSDERNVDRIAEVRGPCA